MSHNPSAEADGKVLSAHSQFSICVDNFY